MYFQADIQYSPGDHVGIYPCNRAEIVDELLNRVHGVDTWDEPLQLQQLIETHTSNGIYHYYTRLKPEKP